MLPATLSKSVDFPTPGLPPISVRLPGTTPPPKTKSNSSLKDENLITSSCKISVIGFAFELELLATIVCFKTSCCSWFNSKKLSQESQDGHFPNHLLDCSPQCWHSKRVFFFFAIFYLFLIMIRFYQNKIYICENITK